MSPFSNDPPPIASPQGGGRAPDSALAAPVSPWGRVKMYGSGLPLVLLLYPLTRIWAWAPGVLGVLLIGGCYVIAAQMNAFTRASDGVLRDAATLRAARVLVQSNIRIAYATAMCLPPILLCAVLKGSPGTLTPLIIASFAAQPLFVRVETAFRAQRVEGASPQEQAALEEVWARTLRQWREPRWSLSLEQL